MMLADSVFEYVPDIFAHLTASEVRYQLQTGFMEDQKDISAKMRAIVVDWLVELQTKYNLKGETLFMAVNLVDRFLARRLPIGCPYLFNLFYFVLSKHGP